MKRILFLLSLLLLNPALTYGEDNIQLLNPDAAIETSAVGLPTTPPKCNNIKGITASWITGPLKEQADKTIQTLCAAAENVATTSQSQAQRDLASRTVINITSAPISMLDYMQALQYTIPVVEAERRAYIDLYELFRIKEGWFTNTEEGLSPESTRTDLDSISLPQDKISELLRFSDVVYSLLYVTEHDASQASLNEDILRPYPNRINARYWRLLPLVVNTNSIPGTYSQFFSEQPATTEGENDTQVMDTTDAMTLLPDLTRPEESRAESIFPLSEGRTVYVPVDENNREPLPFISEAFKKITRIKSDYICASWTGNIYGTDCAENKLSGLKADRSLQENTFHPVLMEALNRFEANQSACQALSDKAWQSFGWDSWFHGFAPYDDYDKEMEFAKSNDAISIHCLAINSIIRALSNSNPDLSRPYLLNLLKDTSAGGSIQAIRSDQVKMELNEGDAKSIYNKFKQQPLALFTRHTSWGYMPAITKQQGWPLANSKSIIPTNVTSKPYGQTIRSYNLTWTWAETAQYCAQKGGRLPTNSEALYFLNNGDWQLTESEKFWVEPPYEEKQFYYVLTDDITNTYRELINDSTQPAENVGNAIMFFNIVNWMGQIIGDAINDAQFDSSEDEVVFSAVKVPFVKRDITPYQEPGLGNIIQHLFFQEFSGDYSYDLTTKNVVVDSSLISTNKDYNTDSHYYKRSVWYCVYD